jgi:hypothetical protein
LSREPELLAAAAIKGRAPSLIILVTVREAFLHCGKTLKRVEAFCEPEAPSTLPRRREQWRYFAGREFPLISRDLRARIKELGQRAIARESGVSRRTIERLMKGKNLRPATIARIRRVINSRP